MNLDKELKIAKEIACTSGAMMKRYFFAKDQGVEQKSDGSQVTVADKEINRFVIEELTKNFDDGIIGEEESTSEYGMGRKWFCDPIDGTHAFILGVPTCMFSLALVQDGIPVLGVAYDPFLNLCYWGIKGQGSYCNDERLRVSDSGMEGCVLLSGSARGMIKNPELGIKLIEKGARLATFNGAVYKSCLISRGKAIGYIEAGVNAHDVAAIQVVVEEAGGKVTHFNGSLHDYSKPFKSAVISNGKVHDELIECLSSSS